MHGASPPWVFVSLAFAALAVTVAGCGGAAPAVQAPGASGALTVDAASARFDEAEREVRLAMGEAPNDLAGKYAGAPGQPAPPPPPAAAPAEPRAEVQSDSRATKSGDPCTSACPALSSMRRAATQLCELAGGDGDARCQSAHERLKHAEEQVKTHCPSCS